MKCKFKRTAINNFAKLLLILGLFSLLIVLFYNQNKAVAQTAIQCSTQIPIGEALDQNGSLLSTLYQELVNINNSVFEEIRAAEETMKGNPDKGLEGAEQCSVNNCQAVNCETVTIDCAPCLDQDPVSGACRRWDFCPDCGPSKDCTSPWAGRACPQVDIETSFRKVGAEYEKILKSKKEIFALINGIDEDVNRRMPLCAKENEDIRTGFDDFICSDPACQLNPSSASCPQVTRLEVIEKKLAKAREGFDNCSVSQTEFLQMSRGEIPSKSPMSCAAVVQNEYERKQPDCRCSAGVPLLPPDCEGFNKKSLLNYYCCR